MLDALPPSGVTMDLMTVPFITIITRYHALVQKAAKEALNKGL